MKVKESFPGLVPTLVAIVTFLIIAFAYFPDVLDGKQLGGNDNANFKGMARELADFREETGKEALWSNNMFGGMPGYLTSTVYKGDVLKYLDNLFQMGPRPVSFIFLYLIGFYILMLSLRVNPWLAIAGAIAFAFSSYNFVILAAGHTSKAIAIGYMAPVIAGILLAFRGKRLLGSALTAIFLALQIMAGHLQITYYTLIIVLIFGLTQVYFAFREKTIKELLITVAFLIVAVGFSIAANSARLWTTLEYGKYTMRNPSELTGEENDKTTGLTKSYATQWSYGIDETFSLLIPGFKGGSNDGALSEKSNTYELFARGNPAQAKEVIRHLPLYWGEQASTAGNIYVGAIIVFLFVLGMFVADPRIKWWLLVATILGIALSWGKNFMALTEFFMDHIPGYNKFRTVSMTLVIPAFAMPVLAILALQKILFGSIEKKKLYTALKWSLGIAGGIALLFALLPDLAGNFISARDGSYQPELAKALQADRRSLLRADAIRSLVLICLSAGVILLYSMKKVKAPLAIAALAILFLVDMWPVNKRYLNKEYFSDKKQASQPFVPTAADQYIMEQPGYNNRVLNLTVSMFMDASTPYFHPSIGGYHGAKMRRYQDLIETNLMTDINELIAGLRAQNLSAVYSALATTSALNMLNTRFVIVNPQTQPVVNPYAAGNAWFVDRVEVVANADEDMAVLAKLDIKNSCTLDARYSGDLEKRVYDPDSVSLISLTDYQPNKMVYHSRSATEQFAVFSEIYYDKGWTAYLDGEKSDYFRVNYLLRGMVVPEGDHEIVFEFRPRSYYAGTSVSLVSSILLILALLGALYLEYRKKKPEEEDPGKKALTGV
ncbi:MAG: YfhO family protein [Bacteroidota bacterium]